MLDKRKLKDEWARRAMLALAYAASLLAVLIALGLFLKSRYILKDIPLGQLFFSFNWRPSQGHFGFAPFIIGTVWVTITAMALAVFPALFTAIYLAEYAPKRLRDNVKPVLDVLAGISPVIFGVFGVLIVVPWVKKFAPEDFTGFSVLSAGIVLALMIFPIITQVAEEVLHNVAQELRYSSLALGATKWETVKFVVLKKAKPGIIAALILGLSRAFGETIAVLMVVGCVVQAPKSLFDAGYTLPALIANNYGEMMSVPLYDSALLLAALILLGVTVFFNIGAWFILLRTEKDYV